MNRTITLTLAILLVSNLLSAQQIGLARHALFLEFSGEELAELDRIENTFLEKISALVKAGDTPNYPEFHDPGLGDWGFAFDTGLVKLVNTEIDKNRSLNLYEQTNQYLVSMNWDKSYGLTEVIGFARRYKYHMTRNGKILSKEEAQAPGAPHSQEINAPLYWIPLYCYDGLIGETDASYLRSLIINSLAKKSGKADGEKGTVSITRLDYHNPGNHDVDTSYRVLPQAPLALLGRLLRNQTFDEQPITAYANMDLSKALSQDEMRDLIERTDTQYVEDFAAGELLETIITMEAYITSIALAQSWSAAENADASAIQENTYQNLARNCAGVAGPFLVSRKPLAVGITPESLSLVEYSERELSATIWFKYDDVMELLDSSGLNRLLYEAQFLAAVLKNLELYNGIGEIK